MIQKLIFIPILLFLFSCNGIKEKSNEIDSKTNIEKSKNITTEISTDINRLQKLIDLSNFKPEKVKFKYTFIDNSKGRVPGPSDSFLEAILYFDEETMNNIREIDKNTDFPNPNYRKEIFKFDWLDKEILDELEQSDSLKSSHPDFIFGTGNGKCWYLENKILFVKSRN